MNPVAKIIMKNPWNFLRGKFSLGKCLPLALAVLAFVVTGCPNNDYTVEIKPRGDVIERTLVFYRTDGANSNGIPNYQSFDAQEMAVIAALYPTNSLTSDGNRHVARGEFANAMPGDVGGAGVYSNLTTSLGVAGFYAERFRGNDDFAGQSEKRFQAANQLTDLLVGWSQTKLGREPGYDQLHQFLDKDFRRDLKNASAYLREGRFAGNYKTNAAEEFIVRFGQYLYERNYFTLGEMPGLIGGSDSSVLRQRIQRLVARKMGVAETEPVPAALAFLADMNLMEKSFTNYLADTDAYRAKLKQWQETNPDGKQPEPADVASEAVENLLGADFELFGSTPDHLTVRLSLPAAPLHSNGRWDAALRRVIWETDLEGRTNANQLPFSCYASWAQASQEFQMAHFGKVALTGDELAQYCLWWSSQDATHGGEWDAFLAGLKPGDGLMEKIDAFRFTGETNQVTTNGQPHSFVPSDYPRVLLQGALK